MTKVTRFFGLLAFILIPVNCVIAAPGNAKTVTSAGNVSSAKNSKQPTAEELLKKNYEQSKKLQSYILNTEFTQESERNSPGYPRLTGKWSKGQLFEMRLDANGKHVKSITQSWGDIGPHKDMTGIKKENKTYKSSLWDGDELYLYRESVTGKKANLLILKRDNPEYTVRDLHEIGRRDPFLRYSRAEGLLAHATKEESENVHVRNSTEKIGGSECYVVEAVTAGLEFTYWLDPKYGCQVVRSKMTKRAGGKGGNFGIATQMVQIVEHSDFKNIDGAWIPMKTTERNKMYNVDNKATSKGKSQYIRTKVLLNPDHDALGSFLPDDIKNNTVVFLEGNRNLKYRWKDGTVVDADGKKVDLEKIRSEPNKRK